VGGGLFLPNRWEWFSPVSPTSLLPQGEKNPATESRNRRERYPKEFELFFSKGGKTSGGGADWRQGGGEREGKDCEGILVVVCSFRLTSPFKKAGRGGRPPGGKGTSWRKKASNKKASSTTYLCQGVASTFVRGKGANSPRIRGRVIVTRLVTRGHFLREKAVTPPKEEGINVNPRNRNKTNREN